MKEGTNRWKNFLYLIFLILLVSYYQFKDDTIPEDGFLPIEQLVAKYGYTLVQHQVTTKDGYINSLFRVQLGESSGDSNKMPVLMMHGNLESPDTYLKHGNSSPAFILAQNGFDVWLASSRGSKYSRKHEWLDPDRDQEDYWDFSWEEMGKYDLPAFIDFITNSTEYEKIGYIGFSQGTGQMYYAMSGGCDQDQKMMEYFRSKISVYISMGTTLKFYNNYSPIMNLGYYIYDILEFAFDIFSIRELKGGSKDSLNTNFCLKFNGICQYGAALFADSVIGYNDYDAMRINSMRYPSSTSVKSILHPIQLTRVDRWQCFDYGSDKNIRIYNATHPPEIKINQIRDIPIALFNGRFDRLVGAQDYQWLKEQLNHTIVFDREYDFGHSSFTMAKNMTFFTQDVIDVLNQHN